MKSMKPKELYDKVAGSYDRRHENPFTLWLRLHEDSMVKKLSGKTVDIGCGTGHHLALLDDVMGVDPSKEMLDVAKKTGKTVVIGKAEKLPFADGVFDNTLCLFCVLNICDYKKAAAEMARVLRPGGTAIISVASVWDRGYGFRQRLGIKHPAKDKIISINGNRMHLWLFDKKEVVGIFEKNGLKLVKTKTLFKFQNPRWGDWTRLTVAERLRLRLDALPLPRDYGAMYIMVFRKSV
jgi:ubiquinone/menaquinone biosynthesis C-methylase UbiE